MPLRAVAALLSTMILAADASAEPAVGPKTWAAVAEPTAGPALSIGGTSNGCLSGAARLPLRGRGFRVAEPERRRFFGHPLLVGVIGDLGREMARRRLGAIPVGDLSQPRGGPADSGHASHQTGLDADLWYVEARPGRPLRKVAMVDLARNRVTRSFGRRAARLLELAAADPRVDRIFVNPVIKRELCRSAAGDRGWLRKLRPWWLHHEHFHVRLACPPTSTGCVPQGAMPEGDGCAEVDDWLAPKGEADRAEKRKAYRSRIGSRPTLPASCPAVLDS